MKNLQAFCSVITLSSVASFSSISIPAPSYPAEYATSETVSSDSTTAPWRVVLDIGREPLANGMPFDWARSGCRMPLVIPCDFSHEQSSNRVDPKSQTVSFTGPDGAVVKPIQGGSWSLDKNEKELSFELTFPETLQRRDVSIPGGTTVKCTGTTFTQTEVDRLNNEFYKAREATWAVGEKLNDMSSRQGAPKKWDEEKGQWVKRYSNENPLSSVQNRLEYWRAKADQDQKNNARPSANDLSNIGRLPGVDSAIYIAKKGVVRAPNGAVMGTWAAEPITPDRTVSYSNR